MEAKKIVSHLDAAVQAITDTEIELKLSETQIDRIRNLTCAVRDLATEITYLKSTGLWPEKKGDEK